jgi:glucokinase
VTITIGVDIGGTKIAAGIVDESGTVLGCARTATPVTGAVAVLDAVAALTLELADGKEISAVGVGAPGEVDPVAGVVRAASEILPGWAGADVHGELTRRLGVPVSVDNDVCAMALGEARFGAGRGIRDVLYLSVGTGIGAAVTRDGLLAHKEREAMGEIAHLPVGERGHLLCGCGSDEHLESWVAGPAIAAAYAARSGAGGLALPEVVARMRAGDDVARRVVVDAAGILGEATTELVSATGVGAVVLGGGVLGIGDEFLDPVKSVVLQHKPSIDVRKAQLGTDAPIIGAALLTLDDVTAVR